MLLKNHVRDKRSCYLNKSKINTLPPFLHYVLCSCLNPKPQPKPSTNMDYEDSLFNIQEKIKTLLPYLNMEELKSVQRSIESIIAAKKRERSVESPNANVTMSQIVEIVEYLLLICTVILFCFSCILYETPFLIIYCNVSHS